MRMLKCAATSTLRRCEKSFIKFSYASTRPFSAVRLSSSYFFPKLLRVSEVHSTQNSKHQLISPVPNSINMTKLLSIFSFIGAKRRKFFNVCRCSHSCASFCSGNFISHIKQKKSEKSWSAGSSIDSDKHNSKGEKSTEGNSERVTTVHLLIFMTFKRRQHAEFFSFFARYVACFIWCWSKLSVRWLQRNVQFLSWQVQLKSSNLNLHPSRVSFSTSTPDDLRMLNCKAARLQVDKCHHVLILME